MFGIVKQIFANVLRPVYLTFYFDSDTRCRRYGREDILRSKKASRGFAYILCYLMALRQLGEDPDQALALPRVVRRLILL